MADEESDYRKRRSFLKMVRESSVDQLLQHLFPGLSMREREEIVEIVSEKGASTGRDLFKSGAGSLADLGVSEWVCKGLAAKYIIQPGIPSSVYNDGCEVIKKNMSSSNSTLRRGLLAPPAPSIELLRRIQRQVRGKSWLELAEADMDPEEREVVNSLFDSSEVAALYGYRALVRIVSRDAPALYQLQDDQCFLGSIFFYLTNSKAEPCSSRTSGSTRDWSQVVWVLQATSRDIEYLEAVGRLVQGKRKIFLYQPERKFGHGVVAGVNFFDIYLFSNPGKSDGSSSFSPDCVDKMLFSLTHPRCFASLAHLMCVEPQLHGFDVPFEFVRR